MKPTLLTVNEAAAIKGVTRQAVWAAIGAGKLATIIVDLPSTRIDPKALERWKVNPNMQRSGKRKAGKKKP